MALRLSIYALLREIEDWHSNWGNYFSEPISVPKSYFSELPLAARQLTKTINDYKTHQKL
jgi:hypothetical protein